MSQGINRHLFGMIAHIYGDKYGIECERYLYIPCAKDQRDIQKSRYNPKTQTTEPTLRHSIDTLTKLFENFVNSQQNTHEIHEHKFKSMEKQHLATKQKVDDLQQTIIELVASIKEKDLAMSQGQTEERNLANIGEAKTVMILRNGKQVTQPTSPPMDEQEININLGESGK